MCPLAPWPGGGKGASVMLADFRSRLDGTVSTTMVAALLFYQICPWHALNARAGVATPLGRTAGRSTPRRADPWAIHFTETPGASVKVHLRKAHPQALADFRK